MPKINRKNKGKQAEEDGEGKDRKRLTCWTLNYGGVKEDGTPQPEKPPVSHWQECIDTGLVRYICYGEEVAPTSGQLHLQGYAEFTQGFSKNRMKAILGFNEIHLEKREGNQTQAINYCKGGCWVKVGKPEEYYKEKNDVFYEFGKKAAAGTVSCSSCALVERMLQDMQNELSGRDNFIQVLERKGDRQSNHIHALQIQLHSMSEQVRKLEEYCMYWLESLEAVHTRSEQSEFLSDASNASVEHYTSVSNE